MSKANSRKYVVIIGDGMSDEPVARFGGKTPLEATDLPRMDRVANQGRIGLMYTTPKGFKAGSDICNMNIMGYSPTRYFTGRAPFEAVSQGIELADDETAFRCNLVHLENDYTVMGEYSAGHIKSVDSHPLIKALDEALGRDGLHFRPGIDYRHLLIWRNAPNAGYLTEPHNIPGKPIADYPPEGPAGSAILDLIRKSWKVLADHPVNRARVAAGKRPANSIWLWGQGLKAKMPAFGERYGIKSSVISAVDLVRGIGKLVGMDVLSASGMTGYIDTNYEGKVKACLDSLADHDLTYIHLEATDEAGHQGKLEDKVEGLRHLDRRVVGPVLDHLEKHYADWRVLLLPDHPTPVERKIHTEDPIPFAILDSKDRGGGTGGYNETAARNSGWVIEDASKFFDEVFFANS